MICALGVVSFPALARQSSAPAAEAGAPNSAAAARTITIQARKFEFDPSEITLKKDQPVQLDLTSEDTKHSLVVPGLGINGVMKKGEVTHIMVTPEKTGDFPGRCGVFCGLGHKHMHFVVHVVD